MHVVHSSQCLRVIILGLMLPVPSKRCALERISSVQPYTESTDTTLLETEATLLALKCRTCHASLEQEGLQGPNRESQFFIRLIWRNPRFLSALAQQKHLDEFVFEFGTWVFPAFS